MAPRAGVRLGVLLFLSFVCGMVVVNIVRSISGTDTATTLDSNAARNAAFNAKEVTKLSKAMEELTATLKTQQQQATANAAKAVAGNTDALSKINELREQLAQQKVELDAVRAARLKALTDPRLRGESRRELNCVHGTADANGICHCFADGAQGFWRGPNCDTCMPGYVAPKCTETCDDQKHCSGHGKCLPNGKCLCHEHWSGQNCSLSNMAAPSPDTNLGDISNLSRLEQIKAIALESWRGYKKNAWGSDEYQPLTKSGENWSDAPPIGVNIVDNLDTLIMMGFTAELAEAREWIRTQFSMKKKTGFISVFETTIRVLGGFLSAYALTNDDLYKEKAEEVAIALLPAFNTPTGFPMQFVNPATGRAHGGDTNNIAEIGTVQMELRYLSRITGNQTYNNVGMKILEYIEAHAPPGLLPTHVRTTTGHFERARYSLGGMCDSYYEYLLKVWILSGKQEPRMRTMYDKAIEDMNNRLVRDVGRHRIVAETDDGGTLQMRMDHLSCFVGGMLALDHKQIPSESRLDTGKRVTEACRETYQATPTKLAPEASRFTERGPVADAAFYLLRPETIESYMYMYRETGDQKYRDWGWEILQAILQHCRVPDGFASLSSVVMMPPPKQNVMPSFWMSETLKYLWLLHSDNSVYSLDKYVFTTEAHPFPIMHDDSGVIGTMLA